ncbi:MAG: helix-turn-helix transcriptional regulator [bacterium]|nr:helix-turn-helix transcriptional regulator [bacterium]
MDTFKSVLLKRIKLMRRAAGYTQQGLADKLGVQRGTVTRWEKDGKGLDLEQIEKIAECLNVSSLQLLDSSSKPAHDIEPLIHITTQLNDKGFQYLTQQAQYLTYVPELSR